MFAEDEGFVEKKCIATIREMRWPTLDVQCGGLPLSRYRHEQCPTTTGSP